MNNRLRKWFRGWHALWHIRRNGKIERRAQRVRERQELVDGMLQRRASLKAVFGAAILATTVSPAYANTVFTAYSFPGTGSPTSRTMPARIADIYNVKEYGATGNGSTDDLASLNAARNAMYGNGFKGGLVFFPPGTYKVTDTFSVSNTNPGSNYTSGRFVGSGRRISAITGNLSNGFVVSQADSTNGPEEIAHLSIINSSTWIASGALFLNDSSATIDNCHFKGMISVLLPFNIYNATFNNCTGEAWSDATTGYNGTLGIAGYATNIKNWRSTAPFWTVFQLWGSNTANIDGCGIENNVVSILLGMFTGWASSCTVSGDILTIGGNLGSTNFLQFTVGSQVFGRGLPLQTWGTDPNDTSAVTIIGDHGTDPALTGVGYAGTYRISTTATIATPIPIFTRREATISGVTINALQTEAAYHIIYMNNATAVTVSSAGGGATPTECIDAFGVTGYTARCGFYIRKASATVFNGCTPNNNPYLGSIYIAPAAVITDVVFNACVGQKLANNITTSIISDGAGGAGTILNVGTFTSGSTIGVGMAVTGAGVTANTVITGNHASDPTLTGSGQTGTYRVNNSQNIASTTITISTGVDWAMPTSTASKAGLAFVGCSGTVPTGTLSGLNNLNMTFNSLPGQAGASNNVKVIEGMRYDIVDCNTATWGMTAAGGGSNHASVRYNGTNWTVVGV